MVQYYVYMGHIIQTTAQQKIADLEAPSVTRPAVGSVR